VDNIGLDLHKRESQLCVLTEDGTVTERRIPTTRERLTAVLGSRPPAQVLLEASTESEWVARHLEALGHTVIVADPNFAPMYASRSRRVKTDKRDARTLADACRTGAYRAAHRTSEAQRHVRAELAVRDTLVRTRARYIVLAKSLCRRDGLRVAPGASGRFLSRLAAVDQPLALRAELTPLLALLRPLNDEIAAADARIAALAARDPLVERLTTAPGVGPVTATAFVATLDDVTRFGGAHQVEAYLGLVPTEDSSGETQRRRDAAPRGDHEGRQPAHALAARRGGVGGAAEQAPRHRGSARVGGAHCGPAREAHGGRDARPPARRRPVRHVAGRDGLRRASPARGGGPHPGGAHARRRRVGQGTVGRPTGATRGGARA